MSFFTQFYNWVSATSCRLQPCPGGSGNTVKRCEEEPRIFESLAKEILIVWSTYWKFRLNRFLIFMKKDTVVDYKKLL